jgi:hypothetical protein
MTTRTSPNWGKSSSNPDRSFLVHEDEDCRRNADAPRHSYCDTKQASVREAITGNHWKVQSKESRGGGKRWDASVPLQGHSRKSL